MAGKKKFIVSLPHNPELERIIMGKAGSTRARYAQSLSFEAALFQEEVDKASLEQAASKKTSSEKKKKRKRHYSPLKSRPDCVACGEWHWIVVTDHSLYRDPFLECGACKETFRMDLTPLDMTYAWRDKIPMPEEVKTKYVKGTKSDNGD